jgi:hypothetical protein
MVGGSLRVLRLLPPLKLVAMIAEILLVVALNIKNQIIKAKITKPGKKKNDKDDPRSLNYSVKTRFYKITKPGKKKKVRVCWNVGGSTFLN